MDISKLSKEEKAELLRKLKEEEKTESIQRKETYEALRHQFMFDVESKLMPVVNDVQGFYDWIVGESKAFRNVMRSRSSNSLIRLIRCCSALISAIFFLL